MWHQELTLYKTGGKKIVMFSLWLFALKLCIFIQYNKEKCQNQKQGLEGDHNPELRWLSTEPSAAMNTREPGCTSSK